MGDNKQEFLDSVSKWYDAVMQAGKYYAISSVTPDRTESKQTGEVVLSLTCVLHPAEEGQRTKDITLDAYVEDEELDSGPNEV